MRQFLLCVFTCLIFICFTSCTKDNAPTTPTPPTQNDSTLLKLFVKLDTLHPASLDTLYKMEFGYDNSKRLISYTYSDFDSATGILINTLNLQLQYHTNDTLPYAGILKEHQQDPPLDNESEYSYYFNNGKLFHLKGYNTQTPQDSFVQKTVYQGDSDITITYSYPLGIYYDTSYHKATITNGNVLQNVTTYSYETSWWIEGIFTFDNLFDNHENPFNRISFVFQLLSYGTLPYDQNEDGSFTKFMATSKNNIVQSRFNRIVYQFSNDNFYAKTYTYSSNGLPVSATYTKQISLPSQFSAGKELYFYTK